MKKIVGAIMGIMLCVSPAVAWGDTVFVDDVIVDGSLAVGDDAVDGEPFGFDTIRMKEAVIRMHFDDTSGSAAFPDNDWRFIINDPDTGSENYFAIEDSTAGRQVFRIDAGVRSHAVHVDASGNVGLGTDTPAAALHVVATDPAIRYDGGSQVWDVKGLASGFELRDVSNGNKRPLYIEADAPTDAVVIKSNGDVGIGTSTTSAKLHVNGDLFVAATLTIGSSRANKEDISELAAADAMEALRDLEPVRFRYKSGSEFQLGFIAEDVPDLVATPDRKSLRPMDLVAVLTKAVQEHHRRIEALRETVAAHDRVLLDLAAEVERVSGGAAK